MSLGIINFKPCSPLLMFVRYGHRLRGKRPGVAKSLAQRLEEGRREDPELCRKNDIGFPFLRPARSAELKQRLEQLKAIRKDPNLEQLARKNKLEINMDEAKQNWMKTAGPFHIRKIAEHYGVFEHLFGKHAFFTPRVWMEINFAQPDGSFYPVYHGNRVKSFEAKQAPEVKFDPKFSMTYDEQASSDSLWTLILTNPDGHLTAENQEYVHWMVGNIPNGDVSKGELIVPYLQPIPPKGTGYHRHIFVLYKQDKAMDYKDLKVADATNLEKRTFNTYEFYCQLQDHITPAGLSFFQADWDDTLTDFYHNVLQMKEPIYDYDYPEAYLADQVNFPKRHAFNLYLDRYSDPKEVNKRYLQQKLAKTHPFDGPEPPLKFPNAHSYDPDEPSWLRTEIMKNRLRKGRINDVEN